MYMFMYWHSYMSPDLVGHSGPLVVSSLNARAFAVLPHRCNGDRTVLSSTTLCIDCMPVMSLIGTDHSSRLPELVNCEL
jgi:hypothetical protein